MHKRSIHTNRLMKSCATWLSGSNENHSTHLVQRTLAQVFFTLHSTWLTRNHWHSAQSKLIQNQMPYELASFWSTAIFCLGAARVRSILLDFLNEFRRFVHASCTNVFTAFPALA